MGRRATPSLDLAATVRRWFGLTQHELARALGVSQSLIAKAEAGLRNLPRVADERLEALARLGPGLGAPVFEPLPPLPSPQAEATPVPAPAPPGPLTPAERRQVARRLARAEQQAYRLRVTFAITHPHRAEAAARWAAALPALQAAATAAAQAAATSPPPNPATTAPPPAVWLARLAAERAAPPPPHTPFSALAVAEAGLRLHLLSHEIGVLRAWLAA